MLRRVPEGYPVSSGDMSASACSNSFNCPRLSSLLWEVFQSYRLIGRAARAMDSASGNPHAEILQIVTLDMVDVLGDLRGLNIT